MTLAPVEIAILCFVTGYTGAVFTLLGITGIRMDRQYGRDELQSLSNEWGLAIGLVNLLIAFTLFWFLP